MAVQHNLRQNILVFFTYLSLYAYDTSCNEIQSILWDIINDVPLRDINNIPLN